MSAIIIASSILTRSIQTTVLSLKNYNIANIFKSLGIESIPLFDKDDDTNANNIAINDEIKKCRLYLESNPNLEKEIGYNGKKTDTPTFISYLDNYNNYEKYKYLVEEVE